MLKTGPNQKTKAKSAKDEKHLKKLMGMLKELQKSKAQETPDLIKKFSTFFSAKKAQVDLTQKLDKDDSFLCESQGQSDLINSPVFAAAALRYPGLLKVFLENGADVNQKGSSTSCTLPQFVVSINSLECLKLLLDEKGYDAISPIGQETPLLNFAACVPNFEAVNLILNHPSFNLKRLDETDHLKRTALYFAAQVGQDDIVEQLLRKGAIFKSDHMGFSIYDSTMLSFFNHLFGKRFPPYMPVAASRNYLKTIQLLLESGLINPLLIGIPNGLHNGSAFQSVFAYLPPINTQGLRERELLVGMYSLFLAHGVGVDIKALPEYIKLILNIPPDAELVVITKTGVPLYTMNAFEAAITKDPSNLNLKSIMNACSSAQVAEVPVVKRINHVIQRVNATSEHNEVKSIQKEPGNSFADDLIKLFKL